jgi:hypothetical protein
MKVFSKKHIDDLVNEISLQKEQLDIFAGTPESPGGRSIIVKNGLKIRHKPSGLVYTVLKVGKDSKNGLHILCSRPGKKLIIPTSDFKNYERQ